MGAGTHVAIRPVRRTLCIFCLFSAVMVVVVNSLNYFSRKPRHISTTLCTNHSCMIKQNYKIRGQAFFKEKRSEI